MEQMRFYFEIRSKVEANSIKSNYEKTTSTYMTVHIDSSEALDHESKKRLESRLHKTTADLLRVAPESLQLIPESKYKEEVDEEC